MIYLIEDRDVLKIGYASNISEREKAYKTHNYYARIISSKSGTKEDEKELHKLCEKWSIEREWFHNVPEVKKIFEDYSSISEEDSILIKQYITTRFIEIWKSADSIDKNIFIDQNIISLIKKVWEIEEFSYNLKPWLHFYDQQVKYLKFYDILKTNPFILNKSEYYFDIFWNRRITEKIE